LDCESNPLRRTGLEHVELADDGGRLEYGDGDLTRAQQRLQMIPFDPHVGVIAAVAVRAGIIVAILAARHRRELVRQIAFGGSALASAITGLTGAAVLGTGNPVHGVLFVHGASGFSFAYSVDALSAWFLVVLSVVAAPIAFFSIGYARHAPLSQRSVFLGIAFNVLLHTLEFVFVAADVIGFLFAWELMTLSAAALVATEHESRPNRRAAYLYLVMSHVGTGAIIAAFFTLVSASHSLSFSTLLAGGVIAGPVRDAVFLLFFIGFGVKAGIIPLHLWLPDAHPAAPSSISALMSGVLIKTGIYGIVRFAAFGLGTPTFAWGVLILVGGSISAVLGVLYALMQHDLKRLLAYHSIENIGIILLGLGAGMMAVAAGHPALAAMGIAAALYHVLNHAVFKGLLFLSAGSVVMATGTRHIEEFGGLLRRMPWTGAFFLIGALAISGLPPLNGFASEWLTFQALLYGFRASTDPLVHFLFPVAGALLALTSALAATCFVKAFGISFLALPRSQEAADAQEVSAVMLVPQACLAALCIVLGLFPGVVIAALTTVMTTLPGVQPPPEMVRGALGMAAAAGPFATVTPAALGLALMGGLGCAAALVALTRVGAAVRRAPTWGCGGTLTSRTEYTATAFSKPLMIVFRAVYRPTREVDALANVSPYFTDEVRYRVEIEPTFERYVYGPLTRTVLRMAERMKMLQAGSLHAYLGYVMALVLTLVLLVWWRS
jgi:hydrogenase-4 component B